MGEDNVLWGAGPIWYGSPQNPIQGFRGFQIAEALRDAHGCALVTPVLGQNVFGLGALKLYDLSLDDVRRSTGRDAIALQRSEYLERSDPASRTYGPRALREFLGLCRLHGDLPA